MLPQTWGIERPKGAGSISAATLIVATREPGGRPKGNAN